MTVYNVKVH